MCKGLIFVNPLQEGVFMSCSGEKGWRREGVDCMAGAHPCVVLFYHSASGNTARVAELIAGRLQSRDIAAVLHAVTKPYPKARLSSCTLVGFGAPVMAFQPSFAMVDFIRALPRQQGIPAFLFTTYGAIPAQSCATLARLLRERGFHVVRWTQFRCTDSWPVLRYFRIRMGFEPPQICEDHRIQAWADSLADQVSALERGMLADAAPPPFFMFDIFYWMGKLVTKRMLRMMMGRKRVDTLRCTRCGLCQRWCAARAITLSPYPRFANSCTGCWGCYNICPEAAIQTFVPASGRYTTQEHLLQQLSDTTRDN